MRGEPLVPRECGNVPGGSQVRRRSDEPMMPERVLNPTLTEAVRLIVDGEHLGRPCGQRLSCRRVGIVNNQADADGRPTERLGADVEGVWVLVNDVKLQAV